MRKRAVQNLFDGTTPQDFFRGSEELGDKEPLTELQMVRRAAELLGAPVPN